MRRFTIAAVLGLSLSLGLPAHARAGTPAGMHAIRVATGGHLLLGSFRGAASSGAVLTSGLRGTRGYFDHLSLTSTVRSPDANVMYASFRAVMHGSSVRGVAIAAYSPTGPSGFALLFDAAARFATSAPLIARQLQATAAGGGPAAGSLPAMQHVAASDGTLTATIPTTWKTPLLALGSLIAVAPREGETVLVNVSFKMIDPRSANYLQEQSLNAYRHAPVGQSLYGLPLAYVASPGRALVAMFEAMAAAGHRPSPEARIVREQAETGAPAGTLRSGVVLSAKEGETAITSESDVTLAPPNQLGLWSLYISATQAPSNVYASELPTMLAILRGYTYNDAAMRSRVAQNIATNEAIGAQSRALADRATQDILARSHQQMNQNAAQFNASMQNAANVQDRIDRSTAGFVHYLGGTTVVENRSTGLRATVDANGAQAAATQDPEHFRIVPVSQYQKGVDF